MPIRLPALRGLWRNVYRTQSYSTLQKEVVSMSRTHDLSITKEQHSHCAKVCPLRFSTHTEKNKQSLRKKATYPISSIEQSEGLIEDRLRFCNFTKHQTSKTSEKLDLYNKGLELRT